MFERIGRFFRRVFTSERARAVGEAAEDAAVVAARVALRSVVDQKLAEVVRSVNRNRRLTSGDKAALTAAIEDAVRAALAAPPEER